MFVFIYKYYLAVYRFEFVAPKFRKIGLLGIKLRQIFANLKSIQNTEKIWFLFDQIRTSIKKSTPQLKNNP